MPAVISVPLGIETLATTTNWPVVGAVGVLEVLARVK
jgi:hypothetical protein